MVSFARRDQLELAQRRRSREEANFAGGVAIGDQQQVGAAAGSFNVDPEAFVGLLVEKRVHARVDLAQSMAVKPVRPLGGFVFNDIKQLAAVSGPRGRSDPLGLEGQEVASR